MFSQKELLERQRQLMEFPEDYDCTTSYHQGHGSEVSDALSRSVSTVTGWITMSGSFWRLLAC